MTSVSIAATALSHRSPDFISIEPLVASELPAAHRAALDHELHMTGVLLSRFPSGLELDVLHREMTGSRYCREIRLLDRVDGKPLLYAAVEIDLDQLPDTIAQAIRRAEQPLGRILMESGFNTTVRPKSFYRVQPGREFAKLAGADDHTPWFAREALIACDGRDAITAFEVPLQAALRRG